MYLDHTNPDSIARNTTSVTAELRDLHCHVVKNAASYADGLQVRLCSDADGALWFATGDVQYDLVHGYACEDGGLMADMTTDEVTVMARDLVEGLVAQLAQLANE